MRERKVELLGAGILLCVSGLLACAEGTLRREDAHQSRTNPFPPVELTSAEPDTEWTDASPPSDNDDAGARHGAPYPDTNGGCALAHCFEPRPLTPDAGTPTPGDSWPR